MSPAEATVEPYIAPSWSEAFLPRRDRSYLAATATAAAAAAAALAWAAADHPELLPALGAFAVLTAVISAGDAVTRRIPNKLNAVALASTLPLLGFAHLLGAGDPPLAASLLRAALGATAAFAAYAALWLVAPGSMGLGDVKLSPYIGAQLGYFGWQCWTNGLIYGFLFQGVIVAGALATRKLQKKSHIAHGPAMCLGALAALIMTLR
ncbi:MAG: prepilin peptidase [Acidimicrobiia bacterium]